ncbi:tetratricopeptide repeat protein [Xanthomonadaceae bacterium JHOS43]|nr:tetratricopeptide repeat protein [Xanthomonadaceae bacterium JHOS43]
MTGNVIRSGAVFVIAALAACASTPPIQSPTAQEEAPPRDVIAEVRAAASAANDGIDVTPLRDPLVADLWEAALRHEAERAFDQAEAALDRALELIPDDPELIQWRAELALVQGRFDDAVRWANASWEKGPRLGGLCRRNWTTIRIARELTGFPDAAVAAGRQVERCTVEPPVRM